MAANNKALLSVEDLWACARIGNASLSPDGRWVVCDVTRYTMTNNERNTALWLFSADGKVRKQLTHAGNNNAAPCWSPDGKTLAFSAKREGDSDAQIYLIDPTGGEAKRLTSICGGVSAIKWFPDSQRLCAIASVWPDLTTDAQQQQRAKSIADSKVKAHVIESDIYRYWDHWIDDGRQQRLFEINASTGKARDLMAKGKHCLLPQEPGINDYAISPDGKEILFARHQNLARMAQEDVELIALNVATCGAKVLVSERGYSFSSPAYSPDGKRIAYVRSRNRCRPELDTLWVQSRASSSKATQWLSRWDRSLGSYGSATLRWTSDSCAILFIAESDGASHLYQAQETEQSAPQVLIAGGYLHQFSLSADSAKIAAVRCSLNHPSQLLFYDSTSGACKRLDRFNDTVLKAKNLGAVESRVMKGFNEQPVQVWLAYPPNYDKRKKYPLLQDIHGGPHAAHLDAWHYRWNMHAFAAQGYVVAAVNYHGSSGFGGKFLGSIEGDLGKREYADIEAVTDALIAEGIADKNNLFAAGGSYGGYMVAYMNGHTDRYKAMVCHAGVYDWIAQYGDDAYSWLKYELGKDYFEDLTHVLKQSPHYYAKNFKTPTLVIHGELDYRVPYYEGLQYYNTLRAKGVSARMVIFPDENHWILKPQNSRLWYQEFFAWLKRFQK